MNKFQISGVSVFPKRENQTRKKNGPHERMYFNTAVCWILPLESDSMATVSNVEYFFLSYVPSVLSNQSVSVAVIFVDPSGTENGVCTISLQNDWQRKVLNLDHDADVEMLGALFKEISDRLLSTDRRAIISQLEEDLFSNVIQVSQRRTCSKDLAREADPMSWMPLVSTRVVVRSVKVSRFDDDHKQMLSIINCLGSA